MNTVFGAPMDTLMGVMLVAFILATSVVAVLALRNRLLFKLGLRNLPRRRAQTLLIIVGLMLSTVIITTAFGAGDSFSYSIRANSVASLGTVDEAVISNTGTGGSLTVNGSGSFNVAAGTVTYMPSSIVPRIAQGVAGADRSAAVLGAIVQSISVQDLTTRQTRATVELAGLPARYPSQFGALTSTSGARAGLAQLGMNEVYLNAKAAHVLNAHVGDSLRLFTGERPLILTVRGIVRTENLAAGGLISSGQRAEATVLVPLTHLQTLTGHPGAITTVLISNTGDPISGATYTGAVTAQVRSLLANSAQVATARTALAGPAGLAALRTLEKDDTIASATQQKLRTLAREVALPVSGSRLSSLLSDPDVNSSLQKIKTPSVAASLNTALAGISDYRVQTLKQDGLDGADQGGSQATSFFLLFGLFSIAAGIMLIFLIFVMLAAERRAEMGMARAVGTKRSHLIQQFLFEGYAYDLGAAVVGLVLGLGVSVAMVAVMSVIFNTQDFSIQRHFEPRSLVVSFCLGALVTFVTVAIASWRVSRLNIVSAIRDLPENIGAGRSLGDSFRAALKSLRNVRKDRKRLIGYILLAAVLVTQSPSPVAGAITTVLLVLLITFRGVWLGLIARGPLLLVDGAALVLVGLSSKAQFSFDLGVSLELIGFAMLLRWVLTNRVPDRVRNRIGYSLAGVLLVVFWLLPFDALQALGVPQLHGDIEMFFLSGMMLVLGAVWTLMYNLDLLLGALLRSAGGLGRLAPILKMAVTYPTQYRFRTGMTMAMFSLVLFTLMVASVLSSSFGGISLNRDRFVGGYDAWGTTSGSNPIRNIESQISANNGLRAQVAAVGGLGRISADLRQPGQADLSWHPYLVNVADDSYLQSVRPTFLHSRAAGYSSDGQVWQALRTHPGYAVVDMSLVKFNDSSNTANTGLVLSGFYYQDKSFKPVHIAMRDARTGAVIPLTVIGVVDQDAYNAFNNPAITGGVFTGQVTLSAAHDRPADPNFYFFRAAPNQSVHRMVLSLGSAFLANGLDLKEAQAEYDSAQAANIGFFNMLRGFLGLGLVVGIAALGVVASRSVVERRQQIGMLRAIGFQRSMVRSTFLLESSFVAVLGTLTGVGLGLGLAKQLIASFAKDDSSLHLVVPWLQVGVIALVAYAASLLTTYLPAWHAARVYPAEALRYE